MCRCVYGYLAGSGGATGAGVGEGAETGAGAGTARLGRAISSPENNSIWTIKLAPSHTSLFTVFLIPDNYLV